MTIPVLIVGGLALAALAYVCYVIWQVVTELTDDLDYFE